MRFSLVFHLDDHGVPHCHAIYDDYAGSFRLEDGELLAGQLPPKQFKKIKEFILQNREELMEAWNDLGN